MASQYLLPCSCGRTVPVEARQAGEILPCPCGATLQVPTMRALVKLASLEAEPVPDRSPSHWGTWQRIFLVGLLICSGALIAAFYVVWQRPVKPLGEPSREVLRARINFMSPLEAWQAWQQLRSERLTRSGTPENPRYIEAVFRYRIALAVTLFMAASGAAAIIAALWTGTHRRPNSGNLSAPSR